PTVADRRGREQARGNPVVGGQRGQAQRRGEQLGGGGGLEQLAGLVRIQRAATVQRHHGDAPVGGGVARLADDRIDLRGQRSSIRRCTGYRCSGCHRQVGDQQKAQQQDDSGCDPFHPRSIAQTRAAFGGQAG